MEAQFISPRNETGPFLTQPVFYSPKRCHSNNESKIKIKEENIKIYKLTRNSSSIDSFDFPFLSENDFSDLQTKDQHPVKHLSEPALKNSFSNDVSSNSIKNNKNKYSFTKNSSTISNKLEESLNLIIKDANIVSKVHDKIPKNESINSNISAKGNSIFKGKSALKNLPKTSKEDFVNFCEREFDETFFVTPIIPSKLNGDRSNHVNFENTYDSFNGTIDYKFISTNDNEHNKNNKFLRSSTRKALNNEYKEYYKTKGLNQKLIFSPNIISSKNKNINVLSQSELPIDNFNTSHLEDEKITVADRIKLFENSTINSSLASSDLTSNSYILKSLSNYKSLTTELSSIDNSKNCVLKYHPNNDINVKSKICNISNTMKSEQSKLDHKSSTMLNEKMIEPKQSGRKKFGDPAIDLVQKKHNLINSTTDDKNVNKDYFLGYNSCLDSQVYLNRDKKVSSGICQSNFNNIIENNYKCNFDISKSTKLSNLRPFNKEHVITHKANNMIPNNLSSNNILDINNTNKLYCTTDYNSSNNSLTNSCECAEELTTFNLNNHIENKIMFHPLKMNNCGKILYCDRHTEKIIEAGKCAKLSLQLGFNNKRKENNSIMNLNIKDKSSFSKQASIFDCENQTSLKAPFAKLSNSKKNETHQLCLSSLVEPSISINEQSIAKVSAIEPSIEQMTDPIRDIIRKQSRSGWIPK